MFHRCHTFRLRANRIVLCVSDESYFEIEVYSIVWCASYETDLRLRADSIVLCVSYGSYFEIEGLQHCIVCLI